MSQTNKFEYNVTQDGQQWNAAITRRVTSRKTSVSKQKKGFATEEEATQWATEALAGYLENLKDANARKAQRRTERNELAQKAETEKEAAQVAYQEKRVADKEAYEESLYEAETEAETEAE
jgi:hypothetical protein